MSVDDLALQDLAHLEDLIANAKQIVRETERELMILRSRVSELTTRMEYLKSHGIVSMEEYKILKSERKVTKQLCKTSETEIRMYKERARNLQIEYGKLNVKIQKELKKETESCGKILKFK